MRLTSTIASSIDKVLSTKQLPAEPKETPKCTVDPRLVLVLHQILQKHPAPGAFIEPSVDEPPPSRPRRQRREKQAARSKLSKHQSVRQTATKRPLGRRKQ